MKKILSVALCACILVSALCMTCSAFYFDVGEPCWEGLTYGEFAEQAKRSAKTSGDEFTGRIMVEFGKNVPFDKMISINDFPGLEIEKVENLVRLVNGSCGYAYITLKDKSYESVIAALKYLENYKYFDENVAIHAPFPRTSTGWISLPDVDGINETVINAAEKWYEEYGENTYYGLFDRVLAEFKHGDNLLDKYDRRMSIGNSKYTYGYQIIAETNTENGVICSEYFNGDADGNKLVNIQDAVRILKYTAHWEGVDVELGADVDLDGLVNVKDCVAVLKLLVDNG